MESSPTYDQDEVALVYASTFPARTDVYSHWTPNGWRPVRSPLTPEIVIAGLTGNGPSISGFMITPPGLAHTLAVDFDTDNGFDQAMALGSAMWSLGLPAYVETSRRGAHLWCVLDAQIEARVIRRAARALLATALVPADDPHIEIRPGSDTVGANGLGHALRLPMMPHPKTGQRGQMYDRTATMSTKVAQILLDVDYAPASEIVAWSERWDPLVDVIPVSYRTPKSPLQDDDACASEILMSLWHVAHAAPGRNSHCPAHGKEDRHPSLTVMRDDKRAICWVPGCLLHNNGKGRGTWELRTMAPAHGR